MSSAFGNCERDEPLERTWSRANPGTVHTKDLTDLPSSPEHNFPHCGDCEVESRGGHTQGSAEGLYKDDDVDNKNARQRHEEEEFLTLGAPMFAFLIG